MKNEKTKRNMIDQLKRTPIIQIACDRIGLSRSTYYRWRKDDKEFARAIDEALSEGSLLVNDLAESQLIAAIKDRNFQAIAYWLRHHHPTYTNRLEVNAHLNQIQEELTPEQEAIVKEALRLASLMHHEELPHTNQNHA